MAGYLSAIYLPHKPPLTRSGGLLMGRTAMAPKWPILRYRKADNGRNPPVFDVYPAAPLGDSHRARDGVEEGANGERPHSGNR